MRDVCRFEWEIKGDLDISDHNVLLIRMLHNECASSAASVRKWVCRNVNFEGYMEDLKESASRESRFMSGMDVNELVGTITSWIHGANDRLMRKCENRVMRRTVWWSDELEHMK